MAKLLVIAPGRGSYNRNELGYLRRFPNHPKSGVRRQYGNLADGYRKALGWPTISELDQADQYDPRRHLPGEHASPLIFTCSAADYALINARHEISAVLGNSMGWYTTLFTGGCLNFEQAFDVVQSMGGLQAKGVVGAQLIYPVVTEAWQDNPQVRAECGHILEDIRGQGEDSWVGVSIYLGGFLVFAGTKKGIQTLMKRLPQVKLGATEYPFILAKHGAFHTKLMKSASEFGLSRFNNWEMSQPKVPMIDGRGGIWWPNQVDEKQLHRYTFSHQVMEPYDLSLSIRVGIREFNPDQLVLLGPGESLGGAIAHVLIREGFQGIQNKQDFMARQKSANPILVSMNRPEQANLVI